MLTKNQNENNWKKYVSAARDKPATSKLKKNWSWFSKSPNLSDSSPNCWHFIIYCHSAIYFLSSLLYRHSAVLTSLPFLRSSSLPTIFSCQLFPSLHFKVKSPSLSFPSHCRPPSANISHRFKSPILVLLSKHFFQYSLFMASGFCDWKLSLNSDLMGPSLQIPLTQLSHHLHQNFICRSSQTLRFLFYSSDTSAHWSLLQISRLNGSYPRYLEGQTSLSDQLIPHNVKCTVYSNLSVILSMLFFPFFPHPPSLYSPPPLPVTSPSLSGSNPQIILPLLSHYLSLVWG